MKSPKEDFPKFILILISIIYGGLIVASPLYVFVTGFLFDAPISTRNLFIYVFAASILSFPLSLSVSLYQAWKNKDKFDVCWKKLKIPIKHFAVICVIWFVISFIKT